MPRASLPALALILAPRAASACAVCFGQGGDGERWIQAFYWGGGILLACVFGILAVLVNYIRRSEARRAERFQAMGLMAEGEPGHDRWPL